MELRRRENELLPPQAGAREKQDVPERSAGALEVLAVKEEMTGGELRLATVDGVVDISSDDSDSDSDYESDEELLVLGNKRSSVRKGSNQEKLSGKKRTADMLQKDSGFKAGEGAQEIVKGQESGNKKPSGKICLVHSQPKTICEAVALLNGPQREKVKELGFGSLLDFRMDENWPLYLVVWLMDHLYPDDQDPDTMVLYFGGNRKLLITQHKKMRCVEVPRAKFFGNDMIPKLVKLDKQEEDGLPRFGKLNLRNQRGTCYDERAESSRHVTTDIPIPGITSDTDIVGTFRSPHNEIQTSDLSSHQSLCPLNENNAKQQLQQLDIRQIEEPEGRREENGDGLNGYDKQQTTVCNSNELFVHQGGDIAMATQGTTPPKEASNEFHGDPKVSAVPQGEHEVTGGSEDGHRDVLVHSVQDAAEDVAQLASTSTKEQVNDFMGGSLAPEILQKLDSILPFLPQIRASVASGVRTSDLEQQVQELTEKLSNKEEELEATREALRAAQSTIANNEEVLEGTGAKLRTAQAFQLEAQSAVSAINSLALRLSATFVRLGADPPSPSGMVSCSSSLEEAVKLLEGLVSHIEPVSRSHATSLARSSMGFVAAALLSRDREKGVKALHDAVDVHTRRFVQSQGPEFHSLVAQVVDAVQKQHGNDAAASTRS